MIDIHHHCLPGVDDGPRDWDEAVALCQMAAADGITTIVATPHVLRGRWQNTSPAVLEQLAADLRERINNSPRIILGSEVFFGHDIADIAAQGDTIIPLAGSRYVLVEFAAHAIPPLVEQPFYRLQLGGWTPVIAHPERNAVFVAKPRLLATLVSLGAKVQITAGSFVGDFGPDAQRAAFEWIGKRIVHIVASDAHNTKKRPPRMSAAFAAVQEAAGEEIAAALFQHNPQAIVDGHALQYDPEPQAVESKRGLLNRVAQFWKR